MKGCTQRYAVTFCKRFNIVQYTGAVMMCSCTLTVFCILNSSTSKLTTNSDLLILQGFPSRAPFSELYNMYKAFMPSDLLRLDPRFFCKALFKALHLNDKDFQFGMTKVFFRPGKFAEFDQLMKSDPENLRRLLVKVKKWIIRSRWRKAQWCALEVIKLKNKIIYRREALLTLQKNMRMALAQKQHRPRYLGLARIKTLRGQVEQIGNMGGNLKRGREEFE